MKFSNLTAFCKHWYKHDNNRKNDWIYMLVCLAADGIYCTSKRDVFIWCANNLDAYKDIYSQNHRFCAFILADAIADNVKRYDMDVEEAFLMYFQSIVAVTENKDYDEFVIPNEKVLPLNVSSEIKLTDSFPNGRKQTLEYFDRERVNKIFKKYTNKNLYDNV